MSDQSDSNLSSSDPHRLRPGDSELSHAELQRGAIHSQAGGRAVRPGQNPVQLFQRRQDVFPFGVGQSPAPSFEHLLFGLTPGDTETMILAAAALVAVALLATYLPAQRAMRVDPMVALRYQ